MCDNADMEPRTLFSKIVLILKQGLPYLGLFVIVVLGSLVADYVGVPRSESDSSEVRLFDTGSSCNVMGIEIRGCIVTYMPDEKESATQNTSDMCDTYTSSEEVVSMIETAAADDNIKAVLLEIDSFGGSPVASEEVATALKALNKPSVAWIRGSGDSGAYWIASAAGTIVASENSDVGGIGVTQSYVDYAEQNKNEGLRYNQLISGKYKDMGSPDRPLTAEERALLQRDLDIMHDNFIRTVAENRKLSIDTVRALADGSTMLGKMAKEKGLVDVLGTKDVVWQTLGTKIGDEPDVCW